MKRLGIATVSLFVGALIYLHWRSDNLTMFIWFERVGLAGVVELLRHNAERFSMYLPNWFLFSLPNSLWLFSGLLAFDGVWGNEPSRGKLFWILAFWIVAVGAEVGQALQMIPGTFDWQDIIFMALAGFCAHLVIFLENQKEKEAMR